MASIFERIALVFRSKANKALDKYEDPRETLDYSYQKQLELLQNVRRGVADVATSRKRVELQASKLNSEVERLQNAAQRALESNREDLAREALMRRSGLTTQITDLQTQLVGLQDQEEKLIQASQRLQRQPVQQGILETAPRQSDGPRLPALNQLSRPARKTLREARMKPERHDWRSNTSGTICQPFTPQGHGIKRSPGPPKRVGA